MAQINPRTFADAYQLGDQIYELILTNWGNRGAKQDPNNGSIQFPTVKTAANGAIPITPTIPTIQIPSCFAIAIAPRSDVDRCILNFPTLPQVAAEKTQIPPGNGVSAIPVSIDQGFINRGGILETEQVLAAGVPLIGQIPGPIIVRAHPAHWFNDTYDQLITGAAQPFGTALNTGHVAPPATFTNPELRLLLYFSAVGALPTGKRAPFFREWQLIQTAATNLVVVPCMGRRHGKVSVRNQSGGTITVDVTGTVNNIDAAGGPAFAALFNEEIRLVDTVSIGAEDSASIALCDLGVSFLLITTGTLAVSAITVSVTLFD